VRLGLSLASLREDSEAGRLLEAGHAGLVASLGEEHDRTRAAAKSLEEFRRTRGP
jgi:hypothetical protein